MSNEIRFILLREKLIKKSKETEKEADNTPDYLTKGAMLNRAIVYREIANILDELR